MCLLRPATIVLPSALSWYGPVPPIGLAYVAGALRQGGHEVTVVDAPGSAIDQVREVASPVGTLYHQGLDIGEVVDRIPADVQLVGVTHMFLHEWPYVRDLVAAVRARFPSVAIVLGGENATGFWPWIFEQSGAVDACVLGEADRTVVELADRVGAGQSWAGLEGVVVRDGSEVCDGGLAPRLTTRMMPEVARPAWDLFPMDAYFGREDGFGVHRGRAMPVLATRGCPYRCSFCSSPQMWTTRYVVREPEDVADEIAGYVERYRVRNINFADLTAITKRSWTLRFCDALEARAPGLIWQLPVGTRAEALDAEVLGRLAQTGCRNVTFAPEAGGSRMLETYDKRVDLAQILRAVRDAHRVGLVSKVNIIVGHPAERWPDVGASLVFLVRAALAGADDAAVMMFGPYPGSADFRALVERGALEVDETYPYTALSWSAGRHQSYNPIMSARVLRLAQLTLLSVFYGVAHLRRPGRLLAHLRAARTADEQTQLDAFIRTRRRRRAVRREGRMGAGRAA